MADTVVPIDPRIADRRQEVHREHRRRWLVRLAVAVGLLVLVALAIGATKSPLLDVDAVEVVGAGRTGTHTVLATAGDLVGTPMIDVDAAAVADRVDDLPWVASATVRREWPSTVVVEVTEREGVAVLSVDAGTWQILDPDGRVLAEQPDRPAGLVELRGVDPGAAPGDRLEGIDDLLAVAAVVDADAVAVITGVRAEEGQVVLDLAPGGTALVGDGTRLADKVEAVVVLLAAVDDRCLVRVDVRVPDMPTITRDPTCAGAAPPTTGPVEGGTGGVGGTAEADPGTGGGVAEVPATLDGSVEELGPQP